MSEKALDELGGRVPPQDLEAEQSTLGSMLIEQGAAMRALGILKPEHFYRDAHAAVFEAMATVKRRTEPVDLVTVSAELRRVEKLDAVGGPEYLLALIGEVPTAAHVARYAQIVHEKALLREVIRFAQEAIAEAYEQPEDPLTFIAGLYGKLMLLQEERAPEIAKASDIISGPEGLFTLYDEGRLGDWVGNVIHTGLPTLDEFLFPGGLIRDTLSVWLGWPKAGKSMLTGQIALNVAVVGKSVLYVSLENTAQEITRRATCYLGQVSVGRLLSPHLDGRDYEAVGKGLSKLGALPFWISDRRGMTIHEVANICRIASLRHGIELIVVDHAQRLRLTGHNDVKALEQAAQILHNLAQELSAVILLVSQLSETEGGRRYEKGARAIGEIADDRFFLMRVNDKGKEHSEGDWLNVRVSRRSGKSGMVTADASEEPVQFKCDLSRASFVDPAAGNGGPREKSPADRDGSMAGSM